MTMVEVLAPQGSIDARGSIVLLGNHKTGKSTLAVIASAAFARRLIDFDAFFLQQTGLRRHAFKTERGPDRFASRQVTLLQELLLSNDKGCIIVCPTAGFTAGEQRLFRIFAQTHPVIQIVSDLEQPFSPRSETGLSTSEFDYDAVRSCSTFEYYNLSEGPLKPGRNSPPNERASAAPPGRPGSSFLRLKRVEQDFLGFLKRVQCQRPDGDITSTAPSLFTYVLVLSLSELLDIANLEGVLCDGPDAVEIKIDPTDPTWRRFSVTDILESLSRGITLVRRAFSGPIVYHVQKPYATPHLAWTHADKARAKAYIDLLSHGLRFCPDYLTVDLSFDDRFIRNVVATRGNTCIIGHYHDAAPGPDGWAEPDRMEHYNRAVSLGCQLVRLTQVAESMTDNLGAQQFIHNVGTSHRVEPRLIAYNTGLLGRLSCCLNQVYTPVCPPPCHVPASKPASHLLPEDPRLTLREAQTALHSAFVLDQLHLWIIGTDLSASLSPPMYRAAFAHMGMPHTWRSKNISSIEEIEDLIKDDNFGGSAIAQGHKMTVLPYISLMSEHAKIIGAVNTLIPIRCAWEGCYTPPSQFWLDRGRAGPIKGIYGDNTDWRGVYGCISKRLSPANAVNAKSTGLVMGAGGMARAAVYAMIQLGVRHIFLYNRTTANGHLLAEHYNKLTVDQEGLLDGSGNRAPLSSGKGWLGSAKVQVIESLEQDWPPGYAQPTMIVCCVRAPVEMGRPQPVVTIPPQWLKSPNGGVVVDTCYDTLLSPLVRQMRNLAHKGWVIVDGLHILPEQAAAQFELFTGRKPPHIRMCIEVLRHYRSEPDAETQEEIQARLSELYGRLGHKPGVTKVEET
ncbi:putative quinate pathway repressor protein QutR [Coniochaeta sp. 2T2.1]|nr:putative quinate pathway repressor protein QutR [Coniochaeta sp. 2T2.1]